MKTMQDFATQQLTKRQMNDVKGRGPISGTCGFFIPGAAPADSFAFYGVSKEYALQTIAGIPGARWCCDGCGAASWLQ